MLLAQVVIKHGLLIHLAMILRVVLERHATELNLPGEPMAVTFTTALHLLSLLAVVLRDLLAGCAVRTQGRCVTTIAFGAFVGGVVRLARLLYVAFVTHDFLLFSLFLEGAAKISKDRVWVREVVQFLKVDKHSVHAGQVIFLGLLALGMLTISGVERIFHLTPGDCPVGMVRDCTLSTARSRHLCLPSAGDSARCPRV